jgi:hypothetical protein
VNLTRELATVHTEFGTARDRLYEAVARCDFKSAGELCAELRDIFKRYAAIRARAAKEAGSAFHTSPRWASHRRAVAAKGNAEQLEELDTRAAIAALNGEEERDGDE